MGYNSYQASGSGNKNISQIVSDFYHDTIDHANFATKRKHLEILHHFTTGRHRQNYSERFLPKDDEENHEYEKRLCRNVAILQIVIRVIIFTSIVILNMYKLLPDPIAMVMGLLALIIPDIMLVSLPLLVVGLYLFERNNSTETSEFGNISASKLILTSTPKVFNQ